MNIIEELYYGNIHPNAKQYKPDSGYANFCQIIADNEQKLTEFLAALPNVESERHLLSQMMNAQMEVAEHNETERFIEGFRLGARFMLDLFVLPDNSVLHDIV